MKLRLNPIKLRLFIFFSFSSSLFNSTPSLGQDSPSPSPNIPPKKENQDPTFEEFLRNPVTKTRESLYHFLLMDNKEDRYY